MENSLALRNRNGPIVVFDLPWVALRRDGRHPLSRQMEITRPSRSQRSQRYHRSALGRSVLCGARGRTPCSFQCSELSASSVPQHETRSFNTRLRQLLSWSGFGSFSSSRAPASAQEWNRKPREVGLFCGALSTFFILLSSVPILGLGWDSIVSAMVLLDKL